MLRIARLVSPGFLAVALLMVVITPAWADADATVPALTREQTAQAPTGKFIQDLGNRAIKVITNTQLTHDQRNAEFGKILADSFDLKTIGHFVIGRAWNTARPEQQAQYMDLFKALMIRNYGDRMTLASGEDFRVVGARPETDEDTIVLSQISHPDGSAPTDIDWRVRQRDGKMGVIDVTVAGVSLSVTQRQEYTAVIQSDGGQVDGLLEKMREQLNPPTAAAMK